MAVTAQSQQLSSLNLPFWARVIANDGVLYHSWVEAYPKGAGTFGDLPAGRSGTLAASPLYATNSSLFPDDAIVLVKRAYFDEDLGWVYVALNQVTGTGSVILTVVTNVCPVVA